VTYHEYLTELTYLLFLKLASELRIESRIKPEYRWDALVTHSPNDLLDHYRALLDGLGSSDDETVRAIFSQARTRLRTDAALRHLVTELERLSATANGLGHFGDVYEGLIQKSAQEARYGAGQYFTPRPLVEAIVTVLKPTFQDTVYDPAAGTGGFLLAAGQKAQGTGHQQPKLFGVELSVDVHRLGLANLLLHDLRATYIIGDALSNAFPPRKYTVCMTNPPFGAKGGVLREYEAALQFPTSNKQLAFLQHVYSRMDSVGRAAIIVPDNVLFEGGIARAIRTHLMANVNLHTVLRLPTGIFYATGVKTSVLFFARSSSTHVTKRVWFYDLRKNGNGSSGALTLATIQPFLTAYGPQPHGTSRRTESDNFWSLTRAQIQVHDDRLDMERVGGNEQAAVTLKPLNQLEVLERELEAANTAVSALRRLIGSSAQPEQSLQVSDDS
jgi:type I restriction enzyme M protein